MIIWKIEEGYGVVYLEANRRQFTRRPDDAGQFSPSVAERVVKKHPKALVGRGPRAYK